MVEGVSELMLGVGLDGPTIGKFIVGDCVTRPGRLTATPIKPGVSRSFAVTSKVILFWFTNVAVRCWALKTTTSPAAKFEPFTVSVNAIPPICALAGENEVIAGSPG